MNFAKFSLVPFQQASLCLDCEMITAAHTHCFVCGSAALLNLARTLDGAESIAHVSGTFTSVARMSAQRDFEPQFASAARYRRPRRIFDEDLPTLHVSTESSERQPSAREPRPPRRFASVIHRVISVAILAVLVGGAAKMPGEYFSGLCTSAAHDLGSLCSRKV
jgi:hypothetical protein